MVSLAFHSLAYHQLVSLSVPLVFAVIFALAEAHVTPPLSLETAAAGSRGLRSGACSSYYCSSARNVLIAFGLTVQKEEGLGSDKGHTAHEQIRHCFVRAPLVFTVLVDLGIGSSFQLQH